VGDDGVGVVDFVELEQAPDRAVMLSPTTSNRIGVCLVPTLAHGTASAR
jgi:hypothetical protein